MPAYRIVYHREDRSAPETAIANFRDLDQALGVFAARGLPILYIAETSGLARSLGALVDEASRGMATVRTGSSFPLKRFSARALA
jgi:hypothetical protein